MRYPEITIESIAKVKGGKRLPNGHDLVQVKTSHPYIRARDIKGGRVSFDEPVFITEETFDFIKNYTVKYGDICITIVGAYVGDVGVVPDFLDSANLTENAVKIVNFNKDIYPKFVAYALQTYDAHSQMQLLAGGSAQPKLGIYKINKIKIPLPPFIIQKQIASILSTYDDLIEINNKRIKILEEMAQLIYREWFVRFKFPGHENVKLTDGVPEGWEEKELHNIVDIQSGYAFKRTTFDVSGAWGLVTIKNVQDGYFVSSCTDRISEIPTSMNKKCFLDSGDILMSLTGNVGRVCLVYGNKFLLNQRVAKLIPVKTEYYSFVYTLFRDRDFQKKLEMMSNGAAQQNLSPVDTKFIKINMPDNDLLEKFHQQAFPMISMIINLYLMNSNLRQTRDFLLPKLMNGEIEVE